MIRNKLRKFIRTVINEEFDLTDIVLDKISKSGLESLTKAEKKYLDRISLGGHKISNKTMNGMKFTSKNGNFIFIVDKYNPNDENPEDFDFPENPQNTEDITLKKKNETKMPFIEGWIVCKGQKSYGRLIIPVHGGEVDKNGAVFSFDDDYEGITKLDELTEGDQRLEREFYLLLDDVVESFELEYM